MALTTKGPRQKRVYVAGPYSKGDVAVNVRNAIMIASKLRDFGYAVFLPHLTHFWHLVCPRRYEDWIHLDLQFLPCCDCLLRFPGESSGADGEVTFAKELGIPVYYSIEELLAGEPETTVNRSL